MFNLEIRRDLPLQSRLPPLLYQVWNLEMSETPPNPWSHPLNSVSLPVWESFACSKALCVKVVCRQTKWRRVADRVCCSKQLLVRTNVVSSRDCHSDHPRSCVAATTSEVHHQNEMPLYDVEHVCALTPGQQEELAKAFTNLHAERFNTPRFFVNVRYTDASQQVVFRGGVRHKYNRVILRTRSGSNRSNELYIEHCRAIVSAWEKIVGDTGETGLRTVWVLGALTTALEAGIARPKVCCPRLGYWANPLPYRQTLRTSADKSSLT